jgi:hypothetical protein
VLDWILYRLLIHWIDRIGKGCLSLGKFGSEPYLKLMDISFSRAYLMVAIV